MVHTPLFIALAGFGLRLDEMYLRVRLWHVASCQVMYILIQKNWLLCLHSIIALDRKIFH